ncbi:alpha/beta hydrolase [Arthrobacter sp. NPDC092385]|uniref:alpha/beta hydrolase n=1 Tax=Arthrobacter sp. NPDC092385 TaxID=3363943 RepID=UPI0037F66B1A
MNNQVVDRSWKQDVLGEGFEQLELPLPDNAVATLVRYTAATQPDPDPVALDADVLYVHGWSDYFFQQKLARFWHRNGARFYALDLHNYGRSLRPGNTPGFVTDLRHYDADLAAALTAMERGPERPLILLGHSTGGLILSWWVHRHPGVASVLILNSPWLEFQGAELGRRAISPLVQLRARRHPLAPLPLQDPGIYSRSLSSEFGGQWTYNKSWRPYRGFPVTSAFLNAVFQAQDAVDAGFSIDVPVLTMLSTRDYLQPRWTETATEADVALNVDVVAHRALSLGQNVTVLRISKAVHDIFLSPAPVRKSAYRQMERWLGGYLSHRD